jgi:hypothetical protein
MTTYAVWCTEYPDDGSTLIEAWTAKGAVRQYRRRTIGRGRADATLLSACEMTPEMLAIREENTK